MFLGVDVIFNFGAKALDAPGLSPCSQRQPFSDMRHVIIPGYGRVSEGRFSSAFDFQEEEEEEDRAKEGKRDGQLQN